MVKNQKRKRSSWAALKSTLTAAFLVFCADARAAQYGPFFPTHNFPTDQSFHAIYRFGLHNTAANFVDTASTDVLADSQSLRNFTHEMLAEYQPNRRFAFGAILRFEQMRLSDASETPLSGSSLGDQRVFAEFRFFDEPGKSIGFASVVKFAGYSIPTEDELSASDDPDRTVVFGDGQIDASLMITSEYWPSEVFRVRADAGMNFRAQGYASQLIYQSSVAFVTPKMDLDFRIKGAQPMGSGGDFSGLASVKEAFGGSDFALSANPRQLIMNPAVALWVSPKLSMHFDLEMSLLGKNSAQFTGYIFGIGYRWAKTKRDRPKTFQEVDIRKNLDGDRFEAEDGVEDRQHKEPVYDEGDIIYE